MSGEWLLRAYPRVWRERYGDELATLIEAEAARGRRSVRIVLDVVFAGLVQRLRSSGLAGDEVPPETRARAGVLLVLSSWAAFTVAGVGFAKSAEHWQAVTPQPDQGPPSAAYDAVVLAAGLGTLAVVLGIVLTARPLLAFLRAGGWELIRRPIARAVASTGATAGVLLGVVVWAHELTNAQRNGGDLPYTAAFLVLAVCGVVSIALWANAAVVTARGLALSRATLLRETCLAGVSAVTMVAMTMSATVWWTSVYGTPARMVCMAVVMIVSTTLATVGTLRSARALRA